MVSKQKKYVCWYSAGITSTIATMLALDTYGKDNVDIIFFETGAHHEDNKRFIKESEVLFGKSIEICKNEKYEDLYDVLDRGFINSPGGAYCTHQLKKTVRLQLEKTRTWDHQVFGFEFEKKEINRAVRFKEQYPNTNPIFPLIDNKLTKDNCLVILDHLNIQRPTMYDLGYSNNNCVGCVKGGMGYWNKIRKDFPEVFDKMARIERKVGATCLKEKDKTTGNSKKLYLDELDPERGRNLKPITGECGVICATEFTDIMAEETDKILDGKMKLEDIKTT